MLSILNSWIIILPLNAIGDQTSGLPDKVERQRNKHFNRFA